MSASNSSTCPLCRSANLALIIPRASSADPTDYPSSSSTNRSRSPTRPSSGLEYSPASPRYPDPASPAYSPAVSPPHHPNLGRTMYSRPGSPLRFLLWLNNKIHPYHLSSSPAYSQASPVYSPISPEYVPNSPSYPSNGPSGSAARLAPDAVTRDQGTNTEPLAAQRLQQALVQARQNLEFSDFSVFADGKEFKCHRIVLASVSGFFRSLFASGMREAIEGKVTLRDMSCGVFDDVLRWAYGGESILTQDNVIYVLTAADLYDIQGLFSDCETFLTENISVDNCVAVYQISQRNQSSALHVSVQDFFLKNFYAISEMEDFYTLSYEDMKSLVSNPQLVTQSEDLVIDSILRWARFGSNQRPDEWQGRNGVEGDEICDGMRSGEENKQAKVGKDKEAEVTEICEGIHSSEDCEQAKIGEDTFKEETWSHSSTAIKVTRKDFASKEVKSLSGTSRNDSKWDRYCQERLSNLPDLLESSRYLLVSDSYLRKTLATDPLVQGLTRCRAIREKIVRYKTQLDRHQHTCPLAACHRDSDPLRNVILTSCGDNLYFRGQDFWEDVQAPDLPTHVDSLVYYDGGIFAHDMFTGVYVLTAAAEDWVLVAPKAGPSHGITMKAKVIGMIPIGSDLVSVSQIKLIFQFHDRYVIECLSLKDPRPAKWKQIGELCSHGMELADYTNIGPKLIFFWRNAGQQSLRIECFDLTRGESFLLQDQLGSHSGDLVTFKHDDEAFVLQEDGSLWRITAMDEEPYLMVKYELRLWSTKGEVRAAILHQGDLWVFGSNFTQSLRRAETREEKTVSLDKVFKDVVFCCIPYSKKGLVHAVLPQAFCS